MNNQQKFRDLLRHAWNYSRFYRQLYENAGITGVDLDEIPLNEFPVVKKSDIMVHFDEVVTDDRLKLDEIKAFYKADKNPQNFYLGEYILVASSAGSDIASYVPYKLPEWRYATTEAATSLLPDPTLSNKPVRSAFYFASQGHWVSTTNASLASRSYHDVLRLSVHDPVELVRAKLNAFKPQRLSTYASSLTWLLEWTREGKLSIAPETVLVSGDSLTPYHRENIKELWGSEIYDLYATCEAIYAAIKKPGEDHYNVFKELVLLEIVDKQHQSVKPGERGRVLVTNLIQKTLPLIRFDLFDYATLGNSNSGAETLLSLDGKSFDTLPVRLAEGGVKRIPVYELTKIQVPGLKRLQFITHNPDHLEVRYLADVQIDGEIDAEVKNLLISRNAAVKRVDISRVDHLHLGRGTKYYNVMNPDGIFKKLASVTIDSFPDQSKKQSPKVLEQESLGITEEYPVHQAFTLVAKRYGDNASIEGDNQTFTYQQLEHLSGVMANGLLETGFDRTRPVAIHCRHQPMMFPLILGILKAGGFYLPLDPNLPPLRIERILQETQPQILVTDQDKVDFLEGQWLSSIRTLTISGLLGAGERSHTLPEVTIEDPACLIYTSGSTGLPRGIIYSHKTIRVRAERYIRDYQVGPEAKLSLLQSYAVSAGIREIFGALLSGAALSIFDLAGEGVQRLPDWIQESGITHLYMVPTVWRLFIETAAEQDFSSLRSIRLGGEPVGLSDLEGFKALKLNSCRLANAYAATETGTICQLFMDPSAAKIPSGSIPVGFPVEGVELQILGEDDSQTPLTLGEVNVHGDSLALGSWDPEQKQILNFNGNPYPTGDLGFQLQDGRVYLSDRKDRLVKIHGYRVNLTEIETAVNAMEGIAAATTIVDNNPNTDARIALFYVLKPGAKTLPDDIQRSLQTRLPNQAVPKRFKQVSSIPKLAGGKVNPYTLASQIPDIPATEVKKVEYKNETERHLARIWKEVLHVDRVERDDDFITLGGDSVMVFRAQILIEKQFHIQLSIQEFFDLIKFKSMAERINQEGLASLITGQSVDSHSSLLVALRREGSKSPLFCVPPAASTAIRFEKLAHHLGKDQPVYAFEYPGMDGKFEPLTSISEMSQRFIEGIQKIQPQGPYYLAGMCYGGVVAFDIAQQLLKSGEPVAFLGILDSNYAPPRRKPLIYYRLSLKKFIHEHILGKQIPIGDLLPRVHRSTHQENGRHSQRIYRVFTTNLYAQLQYTSPPYPGLITKFSTDWRVAKGATIRWQKATTGGLEDHIVPGSHVRRTPEDTRMLDEPNVQVVADVLRECLERATWRNL
jgi:acyl-coenzyme A synthetase/AMP-(fatty) acid ligase/thioesterase domain-containing protein